MPQTEQQQEEQLDLEEFMLKGEEEQEQEQEEHDDVPDYLRDIPEEDRKYAKGWNPDGPKSLEWFISDGKMMEKIDHQNKRLKGTEEEIKRRVQAVDTMRQVQIKALERQLKEAEERKRDAVNMSDLEAVDEAQEEINELKRLKDDMTPKKEENGFTQEDAEFIRDWDIRNPWINADNINHPNFNPDNPDIQKAIYAKKVLKDLSDKGYSLQQMVGEMERMVSEKYPAGKQRHTAPKHLASTTLPGLKSGGGRRLQWKDLTHEERVIYDSMPDGWGSKDEFLQAVEDDRKLRNV